MVKLDKEPAVVVREPGPVGHLAPQNDQLMSERRILGLKPAFRLEWRGQDGQNKANQRNHCPNLADSIIRQTRIGFSVHTPCCAPLRMPGGSWANTSSPARVTQHNPLGDLW